MMESGAFSQTRDMPLPTPAAFPAAPDTLVLAGGGNRCWWQAGLLSVMQAHGAQLPPRIFATSAGAAIAAAAISNGLPAAVQACRLLYGQNEKIFRWRPLLSGRLVFAHQHIYPNWLKAFVDADSLHTLRQSATKLHVAVSRPAPWLGLKTSVGLGTLAYLLDKKVWHRLHPKLPHWLGLKLDFVPLHACESSEDALRLLCAAAAPPPIMPAQQVAGRPAFDGGYTDNAPLPQLPQEEQARTLTLLTRYYPQRPMIFQDGARWYWQPSQAIPVSTWDCTHRATVDAALELGRQDAYRFLRDYSAGLARL